MTKQTAFWAVAGVVMGIAGCASPQQQVAQKENLLRAHPAVAHQRGEIVLHLALARRAPQPMKLRHP